MSGLSPPRQFLNTITNAIGDLSSTGAIVSRAFSGENAE